MNDVKEKKVFSPSFCVTHKCNLNCIYCYQKHDNASMSFDTAVEVVEKIFASVPSDTEEVHIGFIGGEPLLEFDLIKKICEYTWAKKFNIPYLFYATTNGCVLTTEMKKWLSKNNHRFLLGLSLDGLPDCHNYNRSNSFEKIDIPFFRKNYPSEGVKMTLSEYSLKNLAENIKYLHSLGFEIHGSNLAEGDFDWDTEENIKMIASELKKLVEFYVENPKIKECQLFDKKIMFCASKTREKIKWCGIGAGANFYDVDGKEYPCSYCTPMTFTQNQLNEIQKTDFEKDENFIDDDCYENCYLQPVCPSCAGNNFKATGSFKKHDRSKCKIMKLTALFVADLQARKIANNLVKMDNDEKYWTIEAIKKINELYSPEFEKYL